MPGSESQRRGTSPSGGNQVAPGVFAVAAMFLLIPLSAQFFLSSGVPTVACPVAISLFIPAIIAMGFGLPAWLAIFVPSMMFCIWGWPLFRGLPIPPGRTALLYIVVLILASLDWAHSWRLGLKYQGLQYTVATVSIGLAMAIAIAALLTAGRRGPSHRLSLATTFLVWAWIFSYAFPYLGELP